MITDLSQQFETNTIPAPLTGLEMMFHSIRRPDVLTVTLAAAGILMVTMGTRQSFGLFISPINSSTGMGIATISLALAIGQFTWGIIQPIAGAIADRYGSRLVLITQPELTTSSALTVEKGMS